MSSWKVIPSDYLNNLKIKELFLLRVQVETAHILFVVWKVNFQQKVLQLTQRKVLVWIPFSHVNTLCLVTKR